MPRVTVIIPNYNHASFLETRLKSILNQTYQDFEVIFLDDGSSDDSRNVFAGFSSDRRITSVFNETNSGIPFKQWNKGIRLAQGEYIWIAESDDYADQGFLACLVSVLDRNPRVGLAYCNSILVAEHGPCQQWSLPLRWQSNFIAEGCDECQSQLIFRNTIPNASAVLFRRRVYQEAGYADESLRFCGDWLMWLKMLLISDVAYQASPLNYYRRHSGSVSTRMSQTLAFVAERYRLIEYLKGALDLERKVLEQACDALLELWLDVVFAQECDRAFLANLKVYQAARLVDPQLAFRLLQRFARYSLTNLGLFTPLRIARRIVPAAVAGKRRTGHEHVDIELSSLSSRKQVRAKSEPDWISQ